MLYDLKMTPAQVHTLSEWANGRVREDGMADLLLSGGEGSTPSILVGQGDERVLISPDGEIQGEIEVAQEEGS